MIVKIDLMPRFVTTSCFIILVSLFWFGVNPAFASSIEVPEKVITDTQNRFYGVTHLVSCALTGKSISEHQCSSFGITAQNTDGSLLSLFSTTMDAMYTNPPSSSRMYVDSVASNIGFVQEVHAQVEGSGSQVISVVYMFWQASRNLAYVLLAMVFVIVGFMILFGQKMGQSVVSVQAALPNMAVSLILITFSYFFAALFVDITFIGSQAIGYIFTVLLKVSSADPINILNSFNLISIYVSFMSMFNKESFLQLINVLMAADPAVATLFRALTALMIGQVGSGIGGSVASGALGPFIGGLFGAVLGGFNTEGFLSLIGYLILMIALVISMVRLIMDLVKRYISILFLVIFAPLLFTFIALPGNSKVFWGWCKNMLCNVLPFPAVFGMFYFASFFIGPGGLFAITTSSQANPATLPMFGGLNLSIINQVIGIGVLLAIPAVPEFICQKIR